MFLAGKPTPLSMSEGGGSMSHHYLTGRLGATVTGNPNCLKVLRMVFNLGVVLHDSILATEKTGNSISFNLTEEVEKAITEYIYSARPKKKDKHLFLNKNYPHRPMSNSRIYHIVSGYFKSADINIEGKRHGSSVYEPVKQKYFRRKPPISLLIIEYAG